MSKDKYTATWVSHSSMSDFLTCSRAYYLKNVYKDPESNRKVQLINPSLSLGQEVHSVLESLSVLPKGERFSKPLPVKFEEAWEKVGEEESIHTSSWPKHDSKLIVENMVTIPVQVNGKLRSTLSIMREESSDKEKIISLAKEDKNISKWIENKKIKKEIFIQGKLINFVV